MNPGDSEAAIKEMEEAGIQIVHSGDLLRTKND